METNRVFRCCIDFVLAHTLLAQSKWFSRIGPPISGGFGLNLPNFTNFDQIGQSSAGF